MKATRPADGVLRVGVLGCGRIFNGAHRFAYLRTLGSGHLVGFYDPNVERAERTHAQFRAMLEEKLQDPASTTAERAAAQRNLAELRVYPSSAALLEAVDVVDVCTTPEARLGCVVQAAEAGVHAMVEKPSARTWLEAERMREVTEHHGVLFQLNDDNLWDTRYGQVRRLLESGAIDSVHTIWLTRGSQPNAKTVLKWQATAEIAGGGAVMDYGSHGIATVWYLLGMEERARPIRVESLEMAVRQRDRILEDEPFTVRVEDDAHTKILFEDPTSGAWTTVFLESSWSGNELGCVERPYNQWLRIEGSSGVLTSFRDDAGEEYLRVQRWAHSADSARARGAEEVYPVEKDDRAKANFDRGITDFITRVSGGLPPLAGAAFAADVIAVTGAAYLSNLRDGRAITLDEFRQHARAVRAGHADDRSAEAALIEELMAPFRGG
jgi:predicted dehydrogenase